MSDLIPESRIRKPLAESAEEEKLLAIWRKLGSPEIQDQLLDVIEMTANSVNHRPKRSRSRASKS
jgi:hypothetical protein